MALHPAEKYVKDVLSGKIKTGKLVQLACKRYVKDTEQARKKGFVFIRDKAEASISFAAMLNNYKAASGPIKLLPHQQFHFWNIYGWYNKDGSRRFRRSYKEVARKNGKTTESAIRADYRILVEEPEGGHVYCAATKENQANILVTDAGSMLANTPYFSGLVETRLAKELMNRVITKTPPHSFIRSIGRDSKTEDGRHASQVHIDEFHAWQDTYLLNVMEKSMKGRQDPFTDIITTAGLPFVGGGNAGPCYNLRKVCVDILEGHKIDESQFALIYSMDEEDIEDWENSENWGKPNPSLNHPGCVTLKDLQGEFVAARNEGSEKEMDFKVKSLNIWADAPKVWIKDSDWMACAKAPVISKRKWFGGLDLSSTTDLTSYVLISEPDQDGVHDVLPFFWIPNDTLDRRAKEDGALFRTWKDTNMLFTTPGNAIEPVYIKNFILEKNRSLSIPLSAFDQALRGNELAGQLINEGSMFTPISQGIMSLSPYTKDLERLVLQKKLRHGGQPILRWCCRNSMVKIDSNENIKIIKGDPKQRVDGMVALVMAIAAYMKWQETQLTQEEEGFFFVKTKTEDKTK